MIRRHAIFVLLFGLALASSTRAEDALPPSPLPPDRDGRTIIFVSDLHMGVGRDPKNPMIWHATEDFRWHREFADFLDAIHAEGAGKVDLVFLGDFLELWQTPAGSDECQHDDLGEDWGCTEEEAERRAKRVVAQHAAVFEKLGSFATGQNYVTIVPGNHDVAFAFPGVRDLVLSKIGAANDRVRIATEGYWMSADGKLFAEHGQQVGSDPNKFDGWPLKPFHERDGKRYLKQPWGEGFVQQIFNAEESNFPVIDNLASESLGIKYAARDLGVVGTLDQISKFATFILFQQSWAQAIQFLGPGQAVPPDWELDRIDLATSAARWRFVAASLGPGDPIGAQIEANADKMPESPTFTRVELKSACDSRWLRWKTDPALNVTLCPYTGELGGAAESLREKVFPGAKAERFRDRLNEVRTSLPETKRPTRSFELYVYGHTHKEHGLCTPFPSSDPWKPQVINDGAWQRTASEEVYCALIDGKDPKTALRSLQPESLPACYPFVAVLPSNDVMLRYWVQPTGKQGFIRTDCTDLPEIPKKCKKEFEEACPAHP